MGIFSTEACEAEFRLVMDSAPLRASPKGREILDALWTHQFTQKKPSLSMTELAATVYQLPDRLKEDGHNNLRAAVLRLQGTLKSCYQNYLDRADGEICLELFRNPDQHGYALRFVPFPGPYAIATTPERFWTSLHAKILGASREASCRINIFFANQEGRHSGAMIGRSAATERFRARNARLHTGIGETVGAFLLGQTLAKLGLDAYIYPSSTIPDDPRHHDQITVFLGSSFGLKLLEDARADPWLRHKQRYMFKWHLSKTTDHTVYIEDSLTDKQYGCTASGEHSYVGHALISYFYNPSRNQALVAFEGIDTLSTEQAVRELTTGSFILPGLEDKHGSFQGSPYEFEALLGVEVVRNASADCRLLETSTPQELTSLRAERNGHTK